MVKKFSFLLQKFSFQFSFQFSLAFLFTTFQPLISISEAQLPHSLRRGAGERSPIHTQREDERASTKNQKTKKNQKKKQVREKFFIRVFTPSRARGGNCSGQGARQRGVPGDPKWGVQEAKDEQTASPDYPRPIPRCSNDGDDNVGLPVCTHLRMLS